MRQCDKQKRLLPSALACDDATGTFDMMNDALHGWSAFDAFRPDVIGVI